MHERLRRDMRYKAVDLGVLLLFTFVYVRAALFRGPDASWDYRNYHFYQPFAFFNNKLDFDLFPAMQHSFTNPASDVPAYLLWTVLNQHQTLLYIALAVPSIACAFLAFKILLGLVQPHGATVPSASGYTLAILGTLIGATGGGNHADGCDGRKRGAARVFHVGRVVVRVERDDAASAHAPAFSDRRRPLWDSGWAEVNRDDVRRCAWGGNSAGLTDRADGRPARGRCLRHRLCDRRAGDRGEVVGRVICPLRQPGLSFLQQHLPFPVLSADRHDG